MARDGFAQSAPAQFARRCGKLGNLRQQGNAASGGRVEALQPFKRGKRLAGLRGGQGGGLGAVGQFADDPLAGFAGVSVGREGLHPPFARHLVGEPIVGELSTRRVDFRLAGAVSGGDGEPHAAVSGSGIILCKLCANLLRVLDFLRESWCA